MNGKKSHGSPDVPTPARQARRLQAEADEPVFDGDDLLSFVKTLSQDELPRFLGFLEEIRATALARLLSTSPPTDAPDELLEVPEASARLSMSPGYLYRHHKTLPFAVQVEGSRKVLFSAKGIETYVAQRRNGGRRR